MSQVLFLKLSEEKVSWWPDPVPGSIEAQMMGCRCPVYEDRIKTFMIETNTRVFDSECPVHELEPVKEN